MRQLQVIGNIGRDVTVRTNSKGGEFMTFSVAANGRGEKTIWCEVVASKKDGLMPYLTKGRQVFVQGDIDVAVYKDAVDLTVFADKIELVGRPDKEQAPVNDGPITPQTKEDEVTF
jgi:Single-stranded DNA-binding protein